MKGTKFPKQLYSGIFVPLIFAAASNNTGWMLSKTSGDPSQNGDGKKLI
jgi:hypothetical protein